MTQQDFPLVSACLRLDVVAVAGMVVCGGYVAMETVALLHGEGY